MYEKQNQEARKKAGLKVKKLAGEPKKNLSSYMLFCAAQREATKTANPEATAPEMLSLLGKAWKALSEKDKKKYEEEAAADKVRARAARAAEGGCTRPAR